LWGVKAHVDEVFRAVGAEPSVEVSSVDFNFDSVDDAVEQYAANFGPFVAARAVLEPQGRWQDFIGAFRAFVDRFNSATDGAARVRSDYFLILIQR
jgi:hypothetical protein